MCKCLNGTESKNAVISPVLRHVVHSVVSSISFSFVNFSKGFEIFVLMLEFKDKLYEIRGYSWLRQECIELGCNADFQVYFSIAFELHFLFLGPIFIALDLLLFILCC